MAGAIIKVAGTFSNTIGLIPQMPKRDNLLVYSAAVVNEEGEVDNAGSAGPGRIMGTPTISGGAIIADDYLSRIVYGLETPNADGHRFADFQGGYTLAGYSKAFGRGGIGGFMERDPSDGQPLPSADGHGNGRYILAGGVNSTTVRAGAARPDGSLYMPTNKEFTIGTDMVLCVTLTEEGATNDAATVGYRMVTMTPDGAYTVHQNGVPQVEETQQEWRKGFIEWGTSTQFPFFMQASKFAMWNTYLSDAQMIAACRNMLGIVAA